MHMLSCRIRDKVLIGDAVCIEVLEIAEDHVRIGVQSPDQFPEYQEQVIYISDDSRDELLDGLLDRSADPDHHLVGA